MTGQAASNVGIEASLRTGAAYREALRDGRDVWVMGEGKVDDVTTHPATRSMVDEYVAWYDRHHDPAWADRLLMPDDGTGARRPWGYATPRCADDLRRMGRSFAETLFIGAGNVTHTPGYGSLIALGVLASARQRNVSAAQIASASRYRDVIARTGRFLTFSAGAAPIGLRLRADPAERAALKIVRETDAGVIVSGKVGMHTSPAYAEDVYIGSGSGVEIGPHRATFVVPVGAPGVRVLCRRRAARPESRFLAPLSSRFDELDGQMWLRDVFIPWERVFLLEPTPEPVAQWLFWHQLYCWLAKAEFTLGLALACAHAMALREHEATIEYLLDIVVDVQTVRSCLVAAELDPTPMPDGLVSPNHKHVAAGSIAMLKARQRISETLRILPGSSLFVAPSDLDLSMPELAEGLEQSFGGGGYSARQRAALLQMASDHVSSALDARESAYELHANGGIPTWRARLRRCFDGYSDLANAVLRSLDEPMPVVDVENIRALPMVPRRAVTVPATTRPSDK